MTVDPMWYELNDGIGSFLQPDVDPDTGYNTDSLVYWFQPADVVWPPFVVQAGPQLPPR